jgi:hypothetical protein
MPLDFCREGNVKACAALRVIGSPQAAAVRFHDGATGAKPDAGAVRLGGVEGIKDLVRVLGR